MRDASKVPMRIDSKGKYYTKVVSTQSLDVLVRLTSGEVIQGEIHVRPDHRLSDEMNDEHRFVSITNAVVTMNGEELYRTAFITINRLNVCWVIPAQAIGERDDHEDEEEVTELEDSQATN